jgi:DNA-binding SARP family transcriptional activator
MLGPLEVVADGEPVAFGTLKERLVLSVLLLHANEFVSRERLIDDLWGEAPPPTARQAVNVYISKLRKTLGCAGDDPIATADGGYRLNLEPEMLDASRMRALVAAGRRCVTEGELETAAQRFREALSLWRGPTLAGLQLESRGRDEVAQLDELRLAVVMDAIDCELALGRHDQALGELGVLVREHPLRERVRAQQMLALYRADRQADALDAYVDARRALVDDLGIEPSEGLQRLQQAILRHDPSLENPERTTEVNGLPLGAPPSPIRHASLPHTPQRARRRPVLLIGVGLLLASAIAIAAVQLLGVGDASSSELTTMALNRCSAVHYQGPGSPDRLVVADLPLQEGVLETTTPMVDAMTLALAHRGYKAGSHRVGLQVCDDATVDNVVADPLTCSENARAYSANPSVIGVVGPFTSDCAKREIPILNRAPGGSVAMVSPSNTYVGLTRGASDAAKGEPSVYYPTGRRNYARVVPTDDVEMVADAMMTRSLGVKRVFVLVPWGFPGAIENDFVRAAGSLGIAIAGRFEWADHQKTYARVAELVARSHADGVFLGTTSSPSAARLLHDLRAQLGRRPPVVSTGFDPGTAALAGAAAEGMTISVPGPAIGLLKGEGARFVASFSKKFGGKPDRFAVNAAQAMDVLLDAVGRSDGTRASVTSKLFATRVSNGILGSFWITPTGDTTLNAIAIYRVTGGEVKTFATVNVPDALVAQD